jgi:hypothetical protein
MSLMDIMSQPINEHIQTFYKCAENWFRGKEK